MNIQKLRDIVEAFESELGKAGKQTGDNAEADAVVQRAHQASRRWLGRHGPLSPAQWRARHPWQPEKVKPDLRSGELKALDAEVAQLDAEYKQAVALWEQCTLEKINRRGGAETDRRIETAAALRDKASDKLQARRSRYYSLLKAEQGERRAAALRAQQAEALEAKTRADDARDKSFAADALRFFGMRA